MRTLEPSTTDEAASLLGDASRSGTRVAIRGAGTKWDWGGPAAATDIVLSTLRLDRLIAHRHGDLTATVEAGASLAAINRVLAEHRQWIPLDPPWSDRATIGGIVSTGDSGPRRHRYGAPRDLIIGVDIARVDGARAKAGGIVVKNVAGYDLARLVTGAFGSLGLVLEATFKLYPLPATSRTIVADLGTTADAAALVAQINASQLTPTAVELQSPPLRLLIRFESMEASVAEQCGIAARIVESCRGRASAVSGSEEEAEWRAHGDRLWRSDNAGGAIAKVTLLPGDLADVLDRLSRAADDERIEVAVIGRAGVGVLFVRLDGDPRSQARVIRSLRDRCSRDRGSVVLLTATDDVKSDAGVWGPMGDAFATMQAVKSAFDPNRLLNPGRGPGAL